MEVFVVLQKETIGGVKNTASNIKPRIEFFVVLSPDCLNIWFQSNDIIIVKCCSCRDLGHGRRT